MSNKNIEIINDGNYRITARRPIKKKRTLFGRILALLISLILTLLVRYYIEVSKYNQEPPSSDLQGCATIDAADIV